MKVLATRSGQVVHATRNCPRIAFGPVFELEQRDVLPHASMCSEPLCFAAFRRREAKAA